MSHPTPPPAPTSPARKAAPSPSKAGAQLVSATPPLSPARSPAKSPVRSAVPTPGSPLHRATQSFESLYTLGRQLGEGNFSIVKECKLKATGETFAVKCIKKASLKKKDLANIHREMDILFKLDHPNIVKLIDVFDNEAGDMCYLVMELVTGGELFDRIIAKDHYTENEAKVVVRTVASVLVYCHAQGIAHRDLKPENLLYATTADNATIKIADFGFAIIAAEGVVMQTMCGTPGYFAPEVIAHRPYEQKCDIWSLGVITYILLCGFPPFYDESSVQEMEKIRRAEYDFPSPYFDDISDLAKDFIRKMLVVDVESRLSADDVLAHPWLVDATANPTQAELDAMPQLRHVGTNLQNPGAIRAKFKRGINAVMALNKTGRLVATKKGKV
ncbi:CAMK/CAMK1 protein kinase [Aphanomyces astaci]|uniref:CAMK/CAMK1 protein kinase n=1 Tax=Aphanomyces astaci TaxID=112090 RepID=W4GUN6_APHAT|nr:CAMK/CAMK1 protein kinase [Aphanomyces astaci]ETV83402.1 CAMK/CAMK1 protein kinase [Aphanomyces astaci]|eukprot:XP_009826832.1 CAMK/CAMK1 protein kinase [Aphanomyces astaci]